MNVLSLFDGMSCGQIALNMAGIRYDKYFASEIDKYAIKVTQHNYPNTIQLGDITKIKGSDLPQIDLVIGGSPCQGFSYAGKGLNFNDIRSKLFFEFIRLLEECQPRWFLLENVKMKAEYADIISYYMKVKPVLIDSADFVPQYRKRLYWTNITIRPHIPKHTHINNIKEQNPHPKYTLSDARKNKLARRFPNYQPTGKSPTLTAELAHSTGNLLSPKLVAELGEGRRATPIECERLQGVPDNYTAVVSDTQRYKMLGNGWTVDVITHIFKGLITE